MSPLSNRYIIVNYHYVHDLPASERGKGVYPCSLADFDRQIGGLSKNFRIVSVPELYRAVQSAAAGKFCAITFDDGLKDHYRNAIPILKKYGVSGTLFIITGTFDGKMPIAHKVHRLRSKLSIPELIGEYNEFMPVNYPEVYAANPISADVLVDKNERYDDRLTSNFKTVIARIPREAADDFLSRLFSNLGWNEAKITRELFMTPEEVKKAAVDGMEIGAHSHGHDSLVVLGAGEVARDIASSMKALSELLKKEVAVFSYPHGQFKAERLSLFEKAGFRFGVTTERRDVKKEDRPMTLPRYDTNDVRDLI